MTELEKSFVAAALALAGEVEAHGSELQKDAMYALENLVNPKREWPTGSWKWAVCLVD